MQLWQTIQTEQNCSIGMSANGLPRPPFEDSGGGGGLASTNWLRTIQIENATNASSTARGQVSTPPSGTTQLLPFALRQYAYQSHPNFGSSPAGGTGVSSAPGATTTTTRHFAAWEQTTTHFPAANTTTPLGQHTHPALLASSVNLKASPVIRPIPSRLNASPGPKPELLGPPLKPPVKLGE